MPLPSAVLTVTQLTSAVKDLLEMGFPQVVVEGEISGLRTTNSKHLYFNLKDEKASVRIVWFNWNPKGHSATIEDGQQVRISGRLTVYEAQGVYQILVSTLEPIGLGEILARLERLKKKLADEGLFDSERKRSIPLFPETIGLVTSPTGAALQDMLRIFMQNGVSAKIRIFPVVVQGADAPSQIVSMLRYLNGVAQADVLVLARGGGSLEDLLAFSDEGVTRAVSDSKIPIVSAIGHEIDTPLTDYAADLRAPTPTAAAELLSRPWAQLNPTISLRKEELLQGIRQKLDKAQAALRDFRSDRLQESFRTVIQPAYQRLDDAKEDLLRAIESRLRDVRRTLDLQKVELEALNPLAVLERGYAVVTLEDGTVIQRTSQIGMGTAVHMRFHKGRAAARIEEINHEEL